MLAQRIEIERDRDAARLAEAVAVPAVPSSRTRLPEVLGYPGAAFVIGARLLVVVRVWPDLALAVQVAIAATGAVALISAAFAVAYTTPGGWTALRTVEDAPRHRLVGVLPILEAPLAALSIGLVLHEADAQTVLLPSAVVALAVAGVAVRVAPGVIPVLSRAVTSPVGAVDSVRAAW